MPTTPAPRKVTPARVKKSLFTFVGADGKTYNLPPASNGAEHVSGRRFRDAALGGEGENMALSLAMLEACRVAPTTLDALYDLPAPKMLDIVNRWMNAGDGEGASLGESGGSST